MSCIANDSSRNTLVLLTASFWLSWAPLVLLDVCFLLRAAVSRNALVCRHSCVRDFLSSSLHAIISCLPGCPSFVSAVELII